MTQLKRENCSRLGRAILDYTEQHSISMREMARQVGITHEGLRSCCWHKANPTESTLRKLSKVLKVPAEDILSWVIEDRIRYAYEGGVADFLLQVIEDMIEAFRILANNYPEDERPSDYELVKQAIEALNPFAGKKGVSEHQGRDSFQARPQTTPLAHSTNAPLGDRTQDRLPHPLHR